MTQELVARCRDQTRLHAPRARVAVPKVTMMSRCLGDRGLPELDDQPRPFLRVPCRCMVRSVARWL